MRITLYPDSPWSKYTVINLPRRYFWAVLLALLAVVAGGIYWSALRLTESWVETQDPRVAELIRAERREFLDAAVSRLGDDSDDMQILMRQLAELGNLIVMRLGLPEAIKPEEVPLPGVGEGSPGGAAGISNLDERFTAFDKSLRRLEDIFQFYGEESGHFSMRVATLPQLDPPPLIGDGDFPISSAFGPRKHPVTGLPDKHKGYDYVAPTGTPVVAAADGFITRVFKNPFYGNAVEIHHGDDLSTLYAHLNKARAEKGIYVRRGDIIGYVGSTGRSTGPHLHFEIRAEGTPISKTVFKKKYRERIAQLNIASGDDGDEANTASNSHEAIQIESPDATVVEDLEGEYSSKDDSIVKDDGDEVNIASESDNDTMTPEPVHIDVLTFRYKHEGEIKEKNFDCMGDGNINQITLRDSDLNIYHYKGVKPEELLEELNSICKGIVRQLGVMSQ